MAKAGFCTECNANSWLNEDGSCTNGHPASCVTGTYEAGQPHLVQVPQRTGHKGLVIGIVAAVIGAILACGLLSAIAVPVFLNASGNAQKKSCFANQRVVAGAVQVYLAENEGAAPPADWQQAAALLVPGIIQKMPTCPAGGTYSLTSAPDGTTVVSCSVHGSATADSAP